MKKNISIQFMPALSTDHQNGKKVTDAIPVEFLEEVKKELKEQDTEDGFMYAAGIDTAIKLWKEQREKVELIPIEFIEDMSRKYSGDDDISKRNAEYANALDELIDVWRAKNHED